MCTYYNISHLEDDNDGCFISRYGSHLSKLFLITFLCYMIRVGYTKKWCIRVCTISLYTPFLHTKKWYIRTYIHTYVPFLCMKNVLFLCTKKRYLHTISTVQRNSSYVCTGSLYQECTYCFLVQRNNTVSLYQEYTYCFLVQRNGTQETVCKQRNGMYIRTYRSFVRTISLRNL